MKVETMIYAYLAICFAMIVFNTVCIFVFRRRAAQVDKKSRSLEKSITRQIDLLAAGGQVEEDHPKNLRKLLRRTGNLLAFDETLDRLYADRQEAVQQYLQQIYPVFVYLMMEYLRKDDIMVTFYLYILTKYRVLYQKPIGAIHDIVQALIHEDGIYCRENALQAIYSCGDADSVLQALSAVDESGRFHNSKLISDGLLTFAGDREVLADKLWAQFDSFSLTMQMTILNYFRFSSDAHKDRMLALLTDITRHDELKFASIRYFGKYADDRAYPLLLELAQSRNAARWEYAAIATAALSAYPSAHTTDVLKENLHSSNWHIRYNAAQSLEAINVEYTDMIDVFEGNDRYAREMLQYRLDQRRGREMARRDGRTV